MTTQTNVWTARQLASPEAVAALNFSRDVVNRGVGRVSSDLQRGLSTGIESLNDNQLEELRRSADSVCLGIESYAQEHSSALNLTVAQKKAAQIAVAVSSDFRAAANQRFKHGSDEVARPGIENYHSDSARLGQTFTVAYNMLAPRQEPGVELFFPTCVQPPESAGFSVTIQLINLVDDYKRQPGDEPKENIGRRNLLKAMIDPTLIKNDMTRGFPIYRPGQTDQFLADAALIPPRDIIYEGEEIKTSPLRPGVSVDLAAVSATDAVLASGAMDYSDVLDQYVALSTLYFAISNKAGDAKQVFMLEHLENNQTSVATQRTQGDSLDMLAAFTTDHMPITDKLKATDGSALDALSDIATSKLTVHCRVRATLEVNLQSTIASVMGATLQVNKIYGEDGIEISLTSGVGKTIADALKGVEFVGYDLNFRRLNANLRQRGQLLETNYRTQSYVVPLLSPLTCLRPMTNDDSRDAACLQALLVATRIRQSIQGVATLLEADRQMYAAGIKNGVVNHVDMGIGGPARFLVNAHYTRETFDVTEYLQSITSSGRLSDLYSLFVNKLRQMIYAAHRDSAYKIAKDALSGTSTDLPEVIILTDPMIARFIMVEGDLRTLGNEFKITVEQTWNETMRGKLFMSFRDSAGAPEGTPNPMNFGMTAWKAEQSLVLPLHRGGSNNIELSVAPSFLHKQLLPILMRLDVLNINEALIEKVSLAVSGIEVKP